MKRSEFLVLSVVIHAILLAAAFMMPVPFPGPKLPKYPEELLYVQRVSPLPRPLSRKGRGEEISPRTLSPLWERVARRARRGGTIPASGPKPSSAFAAAGPPPVQPSTAASPPPIRNTRADSGYTAPAPPIVQPKVNSAFSSPAPSPQPAPPPTPEIKAVAEHRVRPTALGVKTDRETVNFKYQKGWPAPGMARVRINVLDEEGVGGRVKWKAKADEDWVIVSPSSGEAPGVVGIGVNPDKLSAGFYDTKVAITPAEPGMKGDEVDVTLMALPKEKGKPYLPHFAYDEYLNGECKVCHMPEELMPSPDFMSKPGFCALCHNPSGMAKAFIVPFGGHPIGIMAGAGGTKLPSFGTDPKGPRSDRMDTHLPGGKVVCVTCHNVMEKPGDFGRTWEPASSEDGANWWLYKGGWDGMGYIVPKVYITEQVNRMPKKVRDMRRLEVVPSRYDYDETEGVIIFKKPLPKSSTVYVTLANPYLRVTTGNNALCYDCHSQNTHQGLNCLVCHRIHGGGNFKAVRDMVRTPYGAKRVYFGGQKSFADGSGSGICEVCHPLSAGHLKYRGRDCTKCHSHKDGFN